MTVRVPPSARGRVGALCLIAAVVGSAGTAAAIASPRPAAGTGAPVFEPAALPADSPAVTVVLLHGLGRTHRSMNMMAAGLEAEGYRVVNIGYPSRRHSVSALADSVAAELDICCDGGGPVHFVTHSLGGILVRAYQRSHGKERIGRVVMLSPPNRGSEVVDMLPEALVGLVLGPAARQLGTDTGVHRTLPPVEFELGVITGDRSLNPLFSWWIPGADDGKVGVESARVEGAEDFLIVPYSHTWIMQREQVIEQVLSFLATGRFIDSSDGPADPSG